jgi:hypothetical protein
MGVAVGVEGMGVAEGRGTVGEGEGCSVAVMTGRGGVSVGLTAVGVEVKATAISVRRAAMVLAAWVCRFSGVGEGGRGENNVQALKASRINDRLMMRGSLIRTMGCSRRKE